MAEQQDGGSTAKPESQTGRQVVLPKEMRLMIALPAYGRQLYVNCAMGVANLVAGLAKQKLPYRIHTLSDTSISRSRNAIAAEFLADKGNWTHLVMIDADVGFNPRDLIRMIALNKGVVGCALPKRQYDTNSFPKDGAKDWNQAEAWLSTFTADIKLDEGKLQTFGGFVRARHVATAVMVIQRDTFTTMIEKGVAAKMRPDVGGLETDRVDNYYGFFEPIIDPATGMYVGEDFSFCRRWQDCGGEVWCDIQGEYTHTGAHDFKGNLLKTLKARGAKIADTQPAAPAAGG